jgi:hypothetical protein
MTSSRTGAKSRPDELRRKRFERRRRDLALEHAAGRVGQQANMLREVYAWIEG